MLAPPFMIYILPLFGAQLGVICKPKEDAFYFPNGMWLYSPIEFFDDETNFINVYSNVCFIFSELPQ